MILFRTSKNQAVYQQAAEPFRLPALTPVVRGAGLKIIIAAGLTAIFGVALHWLLQPDSLPVRRFEISVAKPLSVDTVQKGLQELRGAGMLYFDRHAAGSALAGLPWIKTVRVQRKWPATIFIKVTSHTPLALWQAGNAPCDEYGVFCTLLSEDGQIFQVPAATVPAGLALVSGPATAAVAVAGQYRAFKRLFAGSDHLISQLWIHPGGHCRVQFAGGLQVDFGKQNRLARARRFLKLYPMIVRDAGNLKIARIDLRYTNGIVVKWVDTQPVSAQTRNLHFVWPKTNS